MKDSVRKDTINGVVWSGIDKISTYFISFVINVIMARLLTPADYGIVGIIAVFISFSQVFIDGGFATALIAKKDRDETDFRTVFVFNLCCAFLIYAFLFVVAPLIENFYNLPQLGSILRVYCLMLIFSSLSAIQITVFSINLNFKTISKVNVPAVVFSGCLGIIMAYLGFGVWAIVGQQLLSAIIQVILAFYYSCWKPKFQFSKERFANLFRFSSKLIVSSLVDRLYMNSYPLFIGKFFPPATLGNYTRGQQFGSLPAGILGSIFNRVTLPLLSKMQEDNEQLLRVYRKYIKMSSFIIFPLMMLVVVMAEPIVKLILTDKWLGCVPFIQILSMAVMIDHVGTINRNLLYVKNHSDWALRLEIAKKTIAISVFLVSTLWGIWGVVAGQWIYGMIAPSLNSYYTNRLIGLSLREQLGDYMGLWMIGVVSAIAPLFIIKHFDSVFIQLMLSFVSYCVIYLLINWICRTEAMGIVVTEIKLYKRNRIN